MPESCQLPISQDAGPDFSQVLPFAEGQLVNVALHEGECAVEVRAGVIAARIDLPREAAVVAALIIHALAPCERRCDVEIAVAPVEFHLQRVIAR